MLFLVHSPAQAVTFTVNSLNDTPDAVINGTCNDGTGACTLRAAIQEANATTTLDTIAFNIGSGTPTIQVGSTTLSPLPTITQPVIINGNTGGATRIELNGTSAGAGANGLTISAGGSTVEALVINRFGGSGIVLTTSGSNVIKNNYIGSDAAGTSVLGNMADGVLIVGVASNTIGGTASSARNVIGGNAGENIHIQGSGATGNLVQGNYIGVDATGTGFLESGDNGVVLDGAPSNTVGGTTSGARNVIANNYNDGVVISGSTASGNLVEGNYIGTTPPARGFWATGATG